MPPQYVSVWLQHVLAKCGDGNAVLSVDQKSACPTHNLETCCLHFALIMETNITDETLQKHSSVTGTAQANFSASIAVFWLITYYLL